MTKWKKDDRKQTSRHWEVRQYEPCRFARMEHQNRDLLYMVYQTQCEDGVTFCMVYYRFKIGVTYAAVHHMVGMGTRCDISVSRNPLQSRLRCMDDSCPNRYVEIGTFDKSIVRTLCRTYKQKNTLSNYKLSRHQNKQI